MFGRLLRRARADTRAGPRLGEDDVIDLARSEIGDRIPLRVAGCLPRPDGFEWRVVTSTLDQGATLRIDDASGIVMHKQLWERRKLFSRHR